MAQDLAPVPTQAPVTDANGLVTQIWSRWFQSVSGSSDQSTSGYQKLAGGVVVQWGVTGSLLPGTSNSVSFPLAFSNTALQVLAGVRDNSAASTAATGHWGTGGYSASGFSLYNRMSIAATFNWIAVGF